MAISNFLTTFLNRHYTTLRGTHAMANSSAGLLYSVFGLILLTLRVNSYTHHCRNERASLVAECALPISIGLLLLVLWSKELKPTRQGSTGRQESRDSPLRQVHWYLFLLSIMSSLAACTVLVWSCTRLQNISNGNCYSMSPVPFFQILVICLSSLMMVLNIISLAAIFFYYRGGFRGASYGAPVTP